MKGKIVLESTNNPSIASDLIATQGFALIEFGLNELTVQQMKRKLSQLIQEDLQTLSKNPFYRDHWMVMNLMFRDQLFADFIGRKLLQNFIEPILGESFIIYSFTSSSMPPNGTNFSRRIHNDAPRFIPGYVTNVGLVVALDDFTSENGATQVLPYSHTQFDTPSNQEFTQNCVEIHAKAGQGLLFNARLWHSGGQNKSNSPRNAITLNFCRSYMRQHFDFCKMNGNNSTIIFNDLARKLIGEKVQMPSSLDEYYVATEHRKYQPGQG